jgi:hypothetical protein
LKDLRLKHLEDKTIMETLSGLKVRLYPESSVCLICKRRLNLLKTDWKRCNSFELGQFTLICGSSFCEDHKYMARHLNQIIKYKSDLATLIVDTGHQISFDLMVKIGRLRYDDLHQLGEIQSYLKCCSAGLDLPLSTIGMVAKRFLEFCRRLHEKYEPQIHSDIEVNGGYILQFDGSTEQKCGKCNLLLMDSQSGHVLESMMVDVENSTSIKQALERIQKKYGDPLAVVSDLKPGFLEVCRLVFGPEVIHILCHYHFLRTFRNDFSDDHAFIKTCLTQKWKLIQGLKKQLKCLRDLGIETNKKLKKLSDIEAHWNKTGDTLGVYRYALNWILDFKHDGSGKGVPFDLPYLDLYDRFKEGKKLIEKIFEKGPPAHYLKYYTGGFKSLLEKTKQLGRHEQGFRKAVSLLEYRRKRFTQLRSALYLEARRDELESSAPLSKKYRLTPEEAEMIPKRITDLIELWNQELKGIQNSDHRAILKRFRNQTEKYKNNLLVPTLTITKEGQTARIVLPRTNNCMERFFRQVKSLLRRHTGRSKLPKEFGSVGALLPYYLSMRDHKIFNDIFKSDRQLTLELAKVVSVQTDIYKNVVAIPKKEGKQQVYENLHVLEA